MSKSLDKWDWSTAIIDASRVGIPLDGLPGITFQYGSTTDDYSSDGGIPTTGWYDWVTIKVGDKRVYGRNDFNRSDPDFNGPWNDDIGKYLYKVQKATIKKEQADKAAAEQAKRDQEQADIDNRNREYAALVESYKRIRESAS